MFNIIPESSFFKPSIYNQKSKAVKSQILQKTQPYPKSKAVFIPSQQIQTIFPDKRVGINSVAISNSLAIARDAEKQNIDVG